MLILLLCVQAMQRVHPAVNQDFAIVAAKLVHDTATGAPIALKLRVLGSTGVAYTLVIGETPMCSCPCLGEPGKGHICKHLAWAQRIVLRFGRGYARPLRR